MVARRGMLKHAVLVCLCLTVCAGGFADDPFDRPIVRRNVDRRLLHVLPAVPTRDDGYQLFAEIAADLEKLERNADGGRSRLYMERQELGDAVGMFDNILPHKREKLPDDFDGRVLALAPHFRDSHRKLLKLARFPVVRFPPDWTAASPHDLWPLVDYLYLDSVRLCRAEQTREAFELLRPLLVVMERAQTPQSLSRLKPVRVIQSAIAHWLLLSRNWMIDEQALLQAIKRVKACSPTVDSGRMYLTGDSRMLVAPIARLPELTDSRLLVASYLGQGAPNWKNLGTLIRKTRLQRVASRLRNASAQCADVMAVLEGHPEPFDLAATLRHVSDLYVERVENLERPWHDQSRRGATRLREEVQSSTVILGMDVMAQFEHLFGVEYSRLDVSTISHVRKQLVAVENPFGKITLCSMMSEDTDDTTVLIYFVQRAAFARARTALALHVYRGRHGHLPERTGQLISDGILTEVPQDPFGDHIHFSPERAIVWSNGPDGMDHGGVDSRFHTNTLQFLHKFMELAMPRDKRPPLPPPMPKPRVPGVDRVTYVRLPQLKRAKQN